MKINILLLSSCLGVAVHAMDRVAVTPILGDGFSSLALDDHTDAPMEDAATRVRLRENAADDGEGVQAPSPKRRTPNASPDNGLGGNVLLNHLRQFGVQCVEQRMGWTLARDTVYNFFDQALRDRNQAVLLELFEPLSLYRPLLERTQVDVLYDMIVRGCLRHAYQLRELVAGYLGHPQWVDMGM